MARSRKRQCGIEGGYTEGGDDGVVSALREEAMQR
jgi:hypothetical protein